MVLFPNKSLLLLTTLSCASRDCAADKGTAEGIGFGQVDVRKIVTSVAQSFHLKDLSRAIDGNDSNGLVADEKWDGLECIPESKRKILARLHQRAKSLVLKANNGGTDVGVLSKALSTSTCPGSNHVCHPDSSSSVGGRCVEKGSNQSSTLHESPREFLVSKRRLQDSDKCPVGCNEAFCNCFLSSDASSDESCLPIIASTCKNGDEVQNCVTPTVTLDYLEQSCAVVECLNDGRSYPECYCERFQHVCEVCEHPEESDNSICTFSEYFCSLANCCNSASDDDDRNACLDNNDYLDGYGEYQQECLSTCTNDTFCGCLQDPYGVDCTNVFVSICQNDVELASCNDPYRYTQIKYFQCPLLLCYYGYGGSGVECQCEHYSTVCDFCSSAEGANNSICAVGYQSICTYANCCSQATDDTEKMACFSQGNTMPTLSTSYGSENGGAGIECRDTCTNDSICNCLQNPYGMDCSNSPLLSFCQNDDELSNCLDPFWFTQIKYFQCPLLSCYGNGNGNEECQCELNSSICDFCSSPDGVGTYNCAFSQTMCIVASCCKVASNNDEKTACLAQGSISEGTLPTWSSSVSATSTVRHDSATTSSVMESAAAVTSTATTSASTSTLTTVAAITSADSSTSTALPSEEVNVNSPTTEAVPSLFFAPTSSTNQSSSSAGGSGGDPNTEDEDPMSESTIDSAASSQENSGSSVINPMFAFVLVASLFFGVYI